MKPGIFHAWLASITELAAGAALVVGLLTPLAAGALIGTLLVAFITNHRKAGFFVFRRPTEGWEYIMNLVAALFAIACLGAGRVVARQRDRLPAARLVGLRRSRWSSASAARPRRWSTFWRPPAPKPAES